MRYAEVLQKDGIWKRLEFEEVKEGDVFAIFERDGTPVVMGNKYDVFVALSNPNKVGHDGNWEVYVDNYNLGSESK